MDKKLHWDHIYQTKASTQVSWYQEHPLLSLQLIQSSGVQKTAQIIDVGGGASTLVDDLLASGFKHLTVLDISPASLHAAQQRLGPQAAEVTWTEVDITQAELPHQTYDVWHDRAVFHFLIQLEDRHRYVAVVRQSVKPGGHVIMATFAADGPTKCSGLDTMRYGPESLLYEFGDGFRLIESLRETHRTPFSTEQKFIYCHMVTEPG